MSAIVAVNPDLHPDAANTLDQLLEFRCLHLCYDEYLSGLAVFIFDVNVEHISIINSLSHSRIAVVTFHGYGSGAKLSYGSFAVFY